MSECVYCHLTNSDTEEPLEFDGNDFYHQSCLEAISYKDIMKVMEKTK